MASTGGLYSSGFHGCLHSLVVEHVTPGGFLVDPSTDTREVDLFQDSLGFPSYNDQLSCQVLARPPLARPTYK